MMEQQSLLCNIIQDDLSEFAPSTFVTFGETMVRDTPADMERPERTRLVHLSMAGSEYTLAMGLGRLGIPSSYITRVPDNPYGRALRNIAHGYTILQAGDQVTVLTDDAYIPEVRQRLSGAAVVSEEPERLGARHREFTIPPGAVVSGRRVRDLSLPPNCILVSVQRGDEVIVPHGDTTLQAGDVVEIFGLEEELDAAESCLSR